MAELTVGQLHTVAADASALAAEFRTRCRYFGGDVDATDDCIAVVTENWYGPRACSDLATARAYVSEIRGMHDALLDVAAKLDSLADLASETAQSVRTCQMALEIDGDLLEPAEVQRVNSRIAGHHDEWRHGCTRLSLTFGDVMAPLETAYAATAGPFSAPVVTGTRTTGRCSDSCPTRWSCTNLGGADPGWHVVESQTGVERIYADQGLDGQLAMVAAGTTGLLEPIPPNAGLDYIVASGSKGPPYFSATLPAQPPPVGVLVFPDASEDPVAYPNRNLGHYLDIPVANQYPQPIALSAANLAPVFGGGVVALAGVDNGTHRAYQVVLEVNDDGRRRARVELFGLHHDETGEVQIHSQHLAVTTDGALSGQTVNYGDPFESGLGAILPSDHGSAVDGTQFAGIDRDPLSLGPTVFP